MKRVLMIAYHFPPLAGSSGIQRTLRFVQQLPQFGWQPLVLSAHPRAYERVSTDLQREVPAGTVVRRAFALDTARHLAVGGRYAGFMARPDRWVSWKFDAIRQGLQMIREFEPEAIWSTYPIATAHLIGAALHRRSGIPWVADFRDPMAQDGYPNDPITREQFVDIERAAILQASCSTFTTPGAARMYQQRYPAGAQRIVVLENGYDEESFAAAEEAASAGGDGPIHPGRLTLLHSGIVYPSERDPTHFFEALAQLRERGAVSPAQLCVRFRASVHDDLLHSIATRFGVDDFIETCPAIGYKEALREMLRADALLVMQSKGCNEQIPAKIYEYLRAKRPILCLSDAVGDTVHALREAGHDMSAQLDSAQHIAQVTEAFLQRVRQADLAPSSAEVLRRSSRLGRTQALSALLDQAAASHVRQTSAPPHRIEREKGRTT